MNHSEPRSLLELPLEDLLAQLGSSQPTPGGGAAAALVGALGAALIEMTANLTVGRAKFVDIEDRAMTIKRRASELSAQLATLADADAEAFERVSTAYKLPRNDDQQKSARHDAIQAALKLAADVPLDTARASARVIDLADEAAPILNPSVISDVLVGALLARAALESAAINVEINLAAMTDAAVAQHYAGELAKATDGALERVDRIIATGRSRFPRS